MRAINHALTGALIGLTIGKPAIAVPVALVSHFVCDMIPHYDGTEPGKRTKQRWLESNHFRYLLYADALLCIVFVLTLAARHPLHWRLAAVTAFVATTPDILFIARYINARAGKTVKLNRIAQFTVDIQWFQRPIGAAVEVAWFAAAVTLLIPFLR